MEYVCLFPFQIKDPLVSWFKPAMTTSSSQTCDSWIEEKSKEAVLKLWSQNWHDPDTFYPNELTNRRCDRLYKKGDTIYSCTEDKNKYEDFLISQAVASWVVRSVGTILQSVTSVWPHEPQYTGKSLWKQRTENHLMRRNSCLSHTATSQVPSLRQILIEAE